MRPLMHMPSFFDFAAPKKPKVDADDDLNLMDPKVDISVGRSFSYLLARPYLEEINMAYATLVRALSADEIIGTRLSVAPFAVSNQISIANSAWAQSGQTATNLFKLDVPGKSVTVTFRLPEIVFQPTGVASLSPEDKKAVNAAISSLLKAKLPTKMTGSTTAFEVNNSLSLAQVSALAFAGLHNSGAEVSAYKPMDPNFKKYSGSVQFYLQADALSKNGSTREASLPAGEQPGQETDIGDAALTARVAVTVVLVFPLQYALWACSAGDLSEFSISEFAEHVNGLSTYHLQSDEKRKKTVRPPERRATMKSFLRRSKQLTRFATPSSTKRMNDDRF